jgi:hypothetical protein
MLSGFNTNIRHRGVLFHVQTEDSGVRNPHIITHLYHHGTILSSEKSKYDDVLDSLDLEGEVKKRMEAQHKSMLKRLRAGAFDGLIDQRLGAGASADVTGSTTQPETPTLPPESEPGAAAGRSEPPRPFGQSVVSEKPLDEVVLEYLVDHARKRKSGGK